MPNVYPQDTYERRQERKSFQILFPLMAAEFWDYLGSDRNDHGVDHAFELIENELFKGYRILSQVKSRTAPEMRKDHYVLDFPVKTANYAVGCSQPFFLFFVNLTTREAFYLPLQEYFLNNPKKLDALEKNKSTIRVFIPVENMVDNKAMRQFAKAQYSYNEELRLKKNRG